MQATRGEEWARGPLQTSVAAGRLSLDQSTLTCNDRPRLIPIPTNFARDRINNLIGCNQHRLNQAVGEWSTRFRAAIWPSMNPITSASQQGPLALHIRIEVRHERKGAAGRALRSGRSKRIPLALRLLLNATDLYHRTSHRSLSHLPALSLCTLHLPRGPCRTYDPRHASTLDLLIPSSAPDSRCCSTSRSRIASSIEHSVS